MLARMGLHLRHNVVGYLALLVALSGSAYAAGLANNSVKSRHIKNGQVKSADVKNNGLTGTDIREASLGEVPLAGAATTAASADDAALLDGLNSTDFLGATAKATDADKLDGQDSSAFALRGTESWQALDLEVPATGCGWVDAGVATGYAPVSYTRDRAGFVHLRGLVRSVDGTIADCGVQAADQDIALPFPAGYRAAFRHIFASMSNHAPARVDIIAGPNALRVVGSDWTNLAVWLTLDGISWRCAPSGQNGCP